MNTGIPHANAVLQIVRGCLRSWSVGVGNSHWFAGARTWLTRVPARRTGERGWPIPIPLYQPGKPLGYPHPDAGAVPVVHAKVGDILNRMASKDVQLFPVEVETQREPYFLVNVIHTVKCIDDQAPEEVSYWTEEDG